MGAEPPVVPVLPMLPPDVMPPLAVPDEPLGNEPVVELELLPSVDVEPPDMLPLVEPLVPVELLPDRPERRDDRPPERVEPVDVPDWPLIVPLPIVPLPVDPDPIVPDPIVPDPIVPDIEPLPVLPLPVDWPPMLPPLIEPLPIDPPLVDPEPPVVCAPAIAGIHRAAAAIIIGIRIFSLL